MLYTHTCQPNYGGSWHVFATTLTKSIYALLDSYPLTRVGCLVGLHQIITYQILKNVEWMRNIQFRLHCWQCHYMFRFNGALW